MAKPPRISVLTSAYRAEAYLAPFFENLKSQTIFEALELVLVLNAPSAAERRLADVFAAQHPDQVQVLEAPQVETLGASWNRAWRAARADFLAPWNVDDRRAPDSLARQAAALDQHDDWSLAYGDYLSVAEYGSEEGPRRRTPAYSPSLFRRALPQGGAFWLLRANVSERVGYFDEQFRVGPDFDLSVRLACAGLRMGRVNGLLGYFTDSQQGLSTRDGAQASAVDRTAIQLRYGIFDKVDLRLILATQIYEIDRCLAFRAWVPLDELLPGYRERLTRRAPLWLLGWLRYLLRGLLRRLGLLKAAHRLADRVWGREI